MSNLSTHSCKDFSSLSSGPKGGYSGCLITFLLHSFSNSSLFFDLHLSCLWKSVHASCFLSWRRCLNATASRTRVAAGGRAPRNPPARLTKPRLAGRDPVATGRGLPAVAVTVKEKCPLLGAGCSSWLVVYTRQVVAYHRDLLLRLTCQLCGLRRCSPRLLSNLVRLSLSFSSFQAARPQALRARFLPSSSVVVHDLHPRICANREDLSNHHSACVDYDFVCVNLAKAKDFVDEPLVDDQLRDFGLVRDGFSQAGFSLLVLLLVILFLQPFQPFQPSDSHIRLHVELPFPAHHEPDHSTDLAQLSGPLLVALLLFLVRRGLGV